MAEIRDFDQSARERHAENAKNFGDHPFLFRGETFHVRANVNYDVLASVAALTEETDGTRVIATVAEAVVNLIDPRDNAIDRFHTVRKDNELPVTFEDLMELLNWLIEEQTSRPPTLAESSSGGSSENGMKQTAILSTAPVGDSVA